MPKWSNAQLRNFNDGKRKEREHEARVGDLIKKYGDVLNHLPDVPPSQIETILNVGPSDVPPSEKLALFQDALGGIDPKKTQRGPE